MHADPVDFPCESDLPNVIWAMESWSEARATTRVGGELTKAKLAGLDWELEFRSNAVQVAILERLDPEVGRYLGKLQRAA